MRKKHSLSRVTALYSGPLPAVSEWKRLISDSDHQLPSVSDPGFLYRGQGEPDV